VGERANDDRRRAGHVAAFMEEALGIVAGKVWVAPSSKACLSLLKLGSLR
jgi:hypothetical protein